MILTDKKKRQVAEFIGYTVMPYNKFVLKHCDEKSYKFSDVIGLFKKDFSVGSPHGFVRQLKHWHPDTDWTHLMEVATFMVKKGLPVSIMPDLTPEATWNDLMKTLKKHLK